MVLSLVKKRDSRIKKLGKSSNKPTLFEASAYLQHTHRDNILKTKQKPGYMWQLFLEYRTLIQSDVYHQYCIAKASQLAKQQQKKKSLEYNYLNIKQLYEFWGNLQQAQVLDQVSSFNEWINENKIKVNGIDAACVSFNEENGQDKVHVTLPDYLLNDSLKATSDDLNKTKVSIAAAINTRLCFRKLQGASGAVLNKTECMLDIYFLKKYHQLNAAQCLEVGKASNKECWHWFCDEYQDYLKISSMSKGLTGAIGYLTEQSERLIKQALNNNFPRISSSKS